MNFFETIFSKCICFLYSSEILIKKTCLKWCLVARAAARAREEQIICTQKNIQTRRRVRAGAERQGISLAGV